MIRITGVYLSFEVRKEKKKEEKSKKKKIGKEKLYEAAWSSYGWEFGLESLGRL